MAKFKVGDRVRCVKDSDNTIPVGLLGTVMENDSLIPNIKWDDARYWNADKPFLYCLRENEMEFAFTLDDAIRSYQAACEQFEAAELAVERAKQAVADAKLELAAALENEK